MEFPFRSKTIAILTDAIRDGYSGTDTSTLLLKAEADPWAPEGWTNKADRLQRLFDAMRQSGDPRASVAALELAKEAMTSGQPAMGYQGAVWWPILRDGLAADGWEWDPQTAKLVPVIPGIEIPQEYGRLEQLLQDIDLDTAAGHYRQAVDSFSRGNWSSANGQVRSFWEELLLGLAERLSGKRPKEVQAALDVLRPAVLVEGEFGLLRGLWAMLQPGAHAGLSDEDEARHHLVVTTAQARYLLNRSSFV